MNETITIDGRVVTVVLDQQGKVLAVYSPFYSDPAGNTLVASFGYGVAVKNIQTWVAALITLLGLDPVPIP